MVSLHRAVPRRARLQASWDYQNHHPHRVPSYHTVTQTRTVGAVVAFVALGFGSAGDAVGGGVNGRAGAPRTRGTM
jgi:hypothetical protein